mmetsp:Transcript_42739/g.96454  ORF Transcript_42739/g.96454 Transcript_42739/m.96454 type:complete len:234 (+) Transcript_42739:221-922(+)
MAANPLCGDHLQRLRCVRLQLLNASSRLLLRSAGGEGVSEDEALLADGCCSRRARRRMRTCFDGRRRMRFCPSCTKWQRWQKMPLEQTPLNQWAQGLHFPTPWWMLPSEVSSPWPFRGTRFSRASGWTGEVPGRPCLFAMTTLRSMSSFKGWVHACLMSLSPLTASWGTCVGSSRPGGGPMPSSSASWAMPSAGVWWSAPQSGAVGGRPASLHTCADETSAPMYRKPSVMFLV